MQFPKTATALVLVGAVGLASAAYGIGSATGGGSATADPEAPAVKRHFEIGPPPGFDDLADKLGVDADELADAMRDFHEQEASEHRDDFTNALAKALGVSADKVEQAFDEIGEVHKVRFDERLAEELGVDAAKVEDAFDAVRPPRPPVRHRGEPVDKLAAALDATRAELRKALREVRAGAQSDWEQHQEELAAYLADRFNLDAGDVKEALADVPRPKIERGPRGPGGPDFHGPGPGGPDGPGFGPGFALPG